MGSLHPPHKETMTPYVLIRELKDSGTGRYGQCGPTHVIEEVSAAAPGGSKGDTVLFSLIPTYRERTVQIAWVVFLARQGKGEKGYLGQKRHSVIVVIRNTKQYARILYTYFVATRSRVR